MSHELCSALCEPAFAPMHSRSGVPGAHLPAEAAPLSPLGDDRIQAQTTLLGSDTARQAIQAMALTGFLNGTQPYACTARMNGLEGDPQWEAGGGRLVRQFSADSLDIGLLDGSGWTAMVSRTTKGSSTQAEISVYAAGDALAREVLDALVRAHGAEDAEDCDVVPIGFWHRSESGSAIRVARDTQAPRWTAIKENYTAAARTQLERLTRLRPETVDGSILLLHGPPGTGKTTALRALAQEWRQWCEFEYVLDPEKLFSSSGYLLDTALNRRSRRSEWRALVLEDCDELLRSDAKQASGQALARLLNLSDGLLGQGSRTLLVMTTNEEVQRLHPAVVRPGRCLAQVEVGALTAAEASRWAGGTVGGDGRGATLAELYARTRQGSGLPQRPSPGEATGLYM